MPTASHTFVWLGSWPGDVDSMTKLGDDPLFNLQWAPTDGNPAGSVEWQQTFGSGTANGERARLSTARSWESIFGIPAGSVITDIQCLSWDELCWGAASVSSRRVRIRLVDSTGTIVHSAGDIIDVSGSPTNLTGIPQAKGSGTLQLVDSAFQSSATQIKLEIQVSIITSGTPNLDLEQDNVRVDVTYGSAGPPPVAVEKIRNIPMAKQLSYR